MHSFWQLWSFFFGFSRTDRVTVKGYLIKRKSHCELQLGQHPNSLTETQLPYLMVSSSFHRFIFMYPQWGGMVIQTACWGCLRAKRTIQVVVDGPFQFYRFATSSARKKNLSVILWVITFKMLWILDSLPFSLRIIPCSPVATNVHFLLRSPISFQTWLSP